MTSRQSAAIAAFRNFEPAIDDFGSEVLEGLSRPQKQIPSKFLYDEEGSRLFDRICELDEYYPTRTEIGLLRGHAAEIAALIGAGSHLIEFGSGSSIKIRILLDALPSLGSYTAVDISREHLLSATEALAKSYRDVAVFAVCADYTRPFELPAAAARRGAKRVGFFPGSTIGNFERAEAVQFLKGAAVLLGRGGEFLVGADLKKDPAILRAAYDDRDGVTAAFNLNLLARINRELGGNFALGAFAHRAAYDEQAGRIEMHLVSRADQTVEVAGAAFEFRTGEHIHTENSHKFTVAGFQALAREAGFVPLRAWTDPQELFSLHYMRAT